MVKSRMCEDIQARNTNRHLFSSMSTYTQCSMDNSIVVTYLQMIPNNLHYRPIELYLFRWPHPLEPPALLLALLYRGIDNHRTSSLFQIPTILPVRANISPSCITCWSCRMPCCLPDIISYLVAACDS